MLRASRRFAQLLNFIARLDIHRVNLREKYDYPDHDDACVARHSDSVFPTVDNHKYQPFDRRIGPRLLSETTLQFVRFTPLTKR